MIRPSEKLIPITDQVIIEQLKKIISVTEQFEAATAQSV